jgi:hypothetical protein
VIADNFIQMGCYLARQSSYDGTVHLPRAREWTRAKSPQKTTSVACNVARPMSERAFLRRKVAS